MIHQVWRLSEYGQDNLGLACTQQGLTLGRTPLIERRDGRFVVRERSEIARLLGRAYQSEVAVARLVPGLTTLAAAQRAAIEAAMARAQAFGVDLMVTPF